MLAIRDPRWGAGIAAFAALGLVLACSKPASDNVASKGDVGVLGIYPCPDHSKFVIKRDADSIIVTQLSVPGGNTLIPEFHDCQRFLVNEGTGYGPLVGIFAFNGLDTLTRIKPRATPLFPPNRPRIPPPPATLALPAVAEVVNFDGQRYTPLGIEPGINCLYVFPDPNEEHGLGAVMVPVGLQEDYCKRLYNPDMNGTPLLVIPQRYHPSFTKDDYPPVARWDWDPVSQNQYVGIKCWDAWCEIGPNDGFSPSPNHPFPLPTAKDRRAYWIKGWNDEQWMALPAGNGVTPSHSLGSLIPNKDLGTYSLGSFDTHWVDVAIVALAPNLTAYQSKFHLTAATMPGKVNRIAMCMGSWEVCRAGESHAPATAPKCPADANAQWWARIVNTGGDTFYRCVTRHDVGVAVPGTARWHWLDKDETIWVACASGCCQVSADE